MKGIYEFNQDKLPEIIESDVNTCAENRYDCNNGADIESNDQQNGKKCLENNSMNACESNGNMSTNEKGTNEKGTNEKGTRKSTNSSEKGSNGCHRESENNGKVLSTIVKTVDNNICTNDEITNNRDDIKDNIKSKITVNVIKIEIKNLFPKQKNIRLKVQSIEANNFLKSVRSHWKQVWSL